MTAAFAAGAYLEIPLTHRSLSSAVALITGHEHPGKPSSRIEWKPIAEFPGTLVIYMGFSRLGAIVPELIRFGKPGDTPAAAISHASTGEQRSIISTLVRLESDVRAAGLTTPAVVIIGPVVGLRPAVSWFESRPLLGKRILITRPRRQAAEMVDAVERLGAIPHVLPAIRIDEPADWNLVDAVQTRMRDGDFDWIVFTSINGVEMFLNRLRKRGRDLRDLGRVKLAAIGSRTTAALRSFHLEADVQANDEMNSEKLVSLLKSKVVGQRVLLAQADCAREVIRDELAQVAEVETVAVYTQVEAVDSSEPAFDLLRRGEIDYAVLTSPNIARAFLSACDATILGRMARGEIRIVTNGPRISGVVRQFGAAVAVESRDPTSDTLIQSMIECQARTGSHETEKEMAKD